MIDIIARHNSELDKWEIDLTGIKDDAEIIIWLQKFVDEDEHSYILSLKERMLYRGRAEDLLEHIKNNPKIKRVLEIKRS